MRELIIRCDHCGKIIEGNPYKVCLEQIDRETDDYSIPRWCPFRKMSKGQKGQQEQGKKYVTDRGLVAFVSNGFGKGGKWMSVARKDTFQGTHRIVTKDLPLRDTREEAQADLDAYAKKRGWKEYI